VHLAQEQVWALAATGASAANIANAGHAVRWFAFFLRTQHPGQGRTARGVGRTGVVAYLQWLAQRARDSTEFQRLDPGDLRRSVIGERLLPSLADPSRRLLVTPQRHCTYVHMLQGTFNRHRQWLHEQGAGDLHVTDEEVPPWPEPDRSRGEEEGRSEDALPETVFLQLLRDEVLALLPAGTRRNMIELQARTGRRPWETRHLRFSCLDWDTIHVDRPDGTGEDRTYPFLTYWMQKSRRRGARSSTGASPAGSSPPISPTSRNCGTCGPPRPSSWPGSKPATAPYCAPGRSPTPACACCPRRSPSLTP
jgi:hypothetical protein